MGLPHKEKPGQDIDHSDFGSEDRDLDTCCGRICSPNKGTVVRDIMRGLLVLLVLAVISVIIFLLCYFLIHDLENKEEAAVQDLVNIFQDSEEIPQADFSISNDGSGNKLDSFNENIHKEKFREKDILDTTTEYYQKDRESFSSGSSSPKTKMEFESAPPSDQFVPVDFQESSSQSNQGGATEISPRDDFEDLYEYEIVKATSVSTNVENECISLEAPLCSAAMPWVVGALPNWLNDTTTQELHESSAFFQAMLVDFKCSVYANQYVCAILEPPCGPDGVPLPPCKAFCQDIIESCSGVIQQVQNQNPAFECSRFPESRDPNVCVDINRVSSTPPVPQDTTTELNPVQDFNSEPTESRAAIQINEVPRPSAAEIPRPVIPERSRPSIPERREPVVVSTTEPSIEEEEEPLICDHSKFLCEDGSDCLTYSSVCDGIQHCLDNSDEWSCAKPDPSFFDNSRRPSLSQMLLGSKLVAVPTDPVALASDNNQEFLGPVSLEAEPDTLIPRKSLASLLSSSGTPVRAANLDRQPEESVRRTPQRTLSAILSSRRSSIGKPRGA